MRSRTRRIDRQAAASQTAASRDNTSAARLRLQGHGQHNRTSTPHTAARQCSIRRTHVPSGTAVAAPCSPRRMPGRPWLLQCPNNFLGVRRELHHDERLHVGVQLEQRQVGRSDRPPPAAANEYGVRLRGPLVVEQDELGLQRRNASSPLERARCHWGRKRNRCAIKSFLSLELDEGLRVSELEVTFFVP